MMTSLSAGAPRPGKLDPLVNPLLAPADRWVHVMQQRRAGQLALLALLNTMTVLRALVAVFYLRQYLYNELTSYTNAWAMILGLVLTLLLYLTDAVDGTASRRWQLVSRFGTLTDPVADKALTWSVVWALVAVASVYQLAWRIWVWPAMWVAIGTEILIIATTLIAAAVGRKPTAGPKGKAKMFAQFTFVPLMLAGMWVVAAGHRTIGEVVLFGSLIPMVVSMVLAIQSLYYHTIEIFGRQSANGITG